MQHPIMPPPILRDQFYSQEQGRGVVGVAQCRNLPMTTISRRSPEADILTLGGNFEVRDRSEATLVGEEGVVEESTSVVFQSLDNYVTASWGSPSHVPSSPTFSLYL